MNATMLMLLLAFACTPETTDPEAEDTDLTAESDGVESDTPDTDVRDDRPTEPYSPSPGVWVDVSDVTWNEIRAESIVCFSFRPDEDDTWAIHAHGTDSGLSHKLAWGFVVPPSFITSPGDVTVAGDHFASDLYLAMGTGLARVGLFNGKIDTIHRGSRSIQHTGGQLILGGSTAFPSWEALADLDAGGRRIRGSLWDDAAAGDAAALYKLADDAIERVALTDGARLGRWTTPASLGERHVAAMDIVGDQAIVWAGGVGGFGIARFTLGDDEVRNSFNFGAYGPDLAAGCTADRY